ncbi:MAG: TIGR02444 family protein [Alphaproteobacteria bacterium]|nr:TIGR02444 family protein [Alphaproteobacteria bacterium]
MDELPPSVFWDFSRAVYSRAGVADACIVLQDRHGIDVNLLLFCCWQAASGQTPLSAATLGRVIGTIGDWQVGVVRHLRGVRRRLKAGFTLAPSEGVAALRQRVAEIELASERIEQQMLTTAIAMQPPAHSDPARHCATAVANLRAYGEAAGIAWRADDLVLLAALLSGAFPGVAGEAPHPALSALVGAPPPLPSA